MVVQDYIDNAMVYSNLGTGLGSLGNAMNEDQTIGVTIEQHQYAGMVYFDEDTQYVVATIEGSLEYHTLIVNGNSYALTPGQASTINNAFGGGLIP